MNDTITQTRLAMRLDGYKSEYERKHVRKENTSCEEWNTAWKAADVARTHMRLTPELVDDVRQALKKL
ncbi:MAG TPA: hypothetical protein VFV38_26215 [Ktedonobacteraceae bacterium]|nr:hypothetical protein [Ktedonobacteraceae bacterium]